MGDMNRMSVNTHVQEVKFNNWRHGLLDIGRRNRMINFRKTKRTTLKLVNPSFADLYRRIAVSEETITFKRRVDTGSDVKLASEAATGTSFKAGAQISADSCDNEPGDHLSPLWRKAL